MARLRRFGNGFPCHDNTTLSFAARANNDDLERLFCLTLGFFHGVTSNILHVRQSGAAVPVAVSRGAGVGVSRRTAGGVSFTICILMTDVADGVPTHAAGLVSQGVALRQARIANNKNAIAKISFVFLMLPESSFSCCNHLRIFDILP